MDSFNSHSQGGKLQISSGVIEKIAMQACLEIEGVSELSFEAMSANKVLDKLMSSRPVIINIKEDVAEIQVSLIIDSKSKVPEISAKVQENVKNSVQNMTSITVGQVNVVVAGISVIS